MNAIAHALATGNPLMRVACAACGRRFERRFQPECDACGGLVEVHYDTRRAVLRDSENPYERYRDLLPVHDASLLPCHARFTPAVHAQRLGDSLGIPKLYLKNETVQPTASTKDRMASVSLPFLWESGVRVFCTSSTGNSSTAYIHAIARFPQMRMHLFTASDFLDRVASRPTDNVVHHIMRGASFVEAFEYAGNFARSHGFVPERGFFNPGRREGLKLAFLEAVDQIPETIDWYVQAVSSAMGVYGTYKGSIEMVEMGRIPRPPHLLCVQQETCAPMVRAWECASPTIRPEHIVRHPTGIAKSILRGDPTKVFPHVRRIVLESGGDFVSVSETEIREARHMVESMEGIRPCFSASVAVAGLVRVSRAGRLPPDQTVLINLTGGDRPPSPDSPNDRSTRWLIRSGDGWVPEHCDA